MLSKLFISAIALILCSCVGFVRNTRTITTQGFRVVPREPVHELQPIDIEVIEAQIDITVATYARKFGIDQDEIRAVFDKVAVMWVIELFPNAISCPTTEHPMRTCSGLYQGPGLVQVWWTNKYWDGKRKKWREHTTPFCPASTALAHEISHLLHNHMTGSADPHHVEPRLFGPKGVAQRSAYILSERVCPWLHE